MKSTYSTATAAQLYFALKLDEDDKYAQHLNNGGAILHNGSSPESQYTISIKDVNGVRMPTCTCPAFQSGKDRVTRAIGYSTNNSESLAWKKEVVPMEFRICKHCVNVLDPDKRDDFNLEGKIHIQSDPV